MFLKLQGRSCLVVGGGTTGEPKIASLIQAGGDVTVIAPEITQRVKSWAAESRISWKARFFADVDLEGCFLVIGATNDAQVNERVFRQAEARGILCNVVDDPPRCDFYYPAVVRRGALQIAISTGGFSPALAQRLRRKLERQFGPEYADWVAQLGRDRDGLRSNRNLSAERRRRMLHKQASASEFRRFVAKRRQAMQNPEVPNGW